MAQARAFGALEGERRSSLRRSRESTPRATGRTEYRGFHEELKARGNGASKNRVARVMREAGIEGVSRRGKKKTTVRGKEARPVPDLVDRDFTATGPDHPHRRHSALGYESPVHFETNREARRRKYRASSRYQPSTTYLSDLNLFLLPSASGAAESSDSSGGWEHRTHTTIHLSTEPG